MVGSPRAAIVADDDEFFHTRTLLRLAAWGLAAAASVAAVVYIARTDLGTKRFATAIAAIGAPPTDPQQVATAQFSARIAGAEREARRALETAQVISADRERLQGRIITMENDLAELASAVHRTGGNEPKLQSEAKPPPEAKAALPSLPTTSAISLMQSRNSVPGWTVGPVPTQPAAPEPKPATSGHTAASGPDITSSVSTPPPPAANIPLPRPAPTASAAAAPDGTAVAKAGEAATNVLVQEPPLKVEYGVDLGPALTVARLRARWTKLAGERPELIKGLRPLVSVRDTGNGKPVEVRLLVGPLANVDGATAFCQALVSTQYLCRPSVFDGQRLAVQ